jgi:hypothetical protein
VPKQATTEGKDVVDTVNSIYTTEALLGVYFTTFFVSLRLIAHLTQ